MSTEHPMTRSPRAVAREALLPARESLPAYSSKYSRKDFTQHQLFAVLALKQFLRLDYRGVEAFLSLVKRPTLEATHGHTRFELLRVDPELHDLIAGLIAGDPLAPDRDPAAREELLVGLPPPAPTAALRGH